MANSEKTIVGVILAAGKGTRMLPFSTRYPKPILPVCNKPLLQHQIELMSKLGIKDIIIVISHLGFEIVRVIGDGSSLGVNIKYVEQQETLGIAHAVGQLEPHISSDFLMFLGDIFFVPNNFSTMIENFSDDNIAAVLAVKEEQDKKAIMKNFSVILDKKGLVKRVIEKPRFIMNKLKGCGIYLFSEMIFDAIRRTPKTAMRDEYEITESIQIMIEDGLLVKAASVIQQDINLTNPVDLLKCNMEQLQITGQENMIGQNVQINDNVKIKNCVIGDNVIIKKTVTLQNSLIFPDVTINSSGILDNMIITLNETIDCSSFHQF